MQIELQDIGKKFLNSWIFNNINYNFLPGTTYGITGANGSGKSTLAKIIAGILPASKGKINYTVQDKAVDPEELYKYLGFTSPYLELIEEFSLVEFVKFHTRFKNFGNLSHLDFIENIGLEASANKKIKYFSSGMKQRLKLGLSFHSNSSFLILDEPTSNLDVTGIKWYSEEIMKIHHKKLILIFSNQKHEYEFCDIELTINKF